jgi:CheY-like chemotaxis protein
MTDFEKYRGSLTSELAANLRHDLRTPVNHIVGYAEMLLEDAPESDATLRHSLDAILAAAREAAVEIDKSVRPNGSAIDAAAIDALYAALRARQQRIVAEVDALLSRTAGGKVDETVVEDLGRIRHAARRLAPTAHTPPDGSRPGAGAAAASTEGASGKRGRVLVVDDDEDNREMLRRRLEREGYDSVCVSDGKRALESLASGGFDLMLLDVLMPDMDGHEVLARVKGSPDTRDIPVIMISALDDMPSIVKCIERGAEDFLPKPFDPVLLRARISSSLAKKRLHDHEREYIKQVARVIEAATAVEKGGYQSGFLKDIAGRSDELGRLARVFDGMAAQVHSREERLREQLRELRADIGFAKNTGELHAQLDGGSLTPGQVFADRYEIIAAIGEGGMGMVYRARDRELDDEIAIKTLRPELVTDSARVERFKTEIRLARKISHRNVVRTHDFGEWMGVYYLTMECVEGITLRELIDSRGALQAPSVLAIGQQLADSLAVAHEQGVIHRDIKPQNLLLDDEGVLKVMDFGVSRLANRASALTDVGVVVGTPTYMSPEQLLGENVDARSDLYAVGVVLYECVTGRLPFDAESMISLIAKLLHEEPTPPSEITADVSPVLAALILRLLAKRPEDRVQTAVELAALLRQVG